MTAIIGDSTFLNYDNYTPNYTKTRALLFDKTFT